jgi:hydroxyacylglutathione hydrolase
MGQTDVASLLRVQLTEQVWLVGSGGTGFSTTHPRDCHVYLIASGGEGVLIDAGAGIHVSPLLAEIERAGAASVVDRILVTHAHADHSGGAAELKEALGAEVHASHEVATYLRSGDAERAGFDVMKGPGGYPEDYQYHSCDVDAELVPGQRLGVGSLEVEVIAAPGHSSGHLAFALHRPGGVDLFSGDAAFAHGRVLLQDLWDCSIRESTWTIRRFAELKPEGFYPGTG